MASAIWHEPGRYRRGMRVSAVAALRIALVAFVLAWLFGPSELRTTVPVWLPFLVAVALELQFFMGARD